MKGFAYMGAVVLAVIGIGVGILAAEGGSSRPIYSSASMVLKALGCSRISAESLSRARGECSLTPGAAPLQMTAVMVPGRGSAEKYLSTFVKQQLATLGVANSFIVGSDWLLAIPPESKLGPWLAHFDRVTGSKLGWARLVQKIS